MFKELYEIKIQWKSFSLDNKFIRYNDARLRIKFARLLTARHESFLTRGCRSQYITRESLVCRSYNLIGSKTKVTFTNQMHTLREERSGSQLHERRLEEEVETLLDRKLPPEGTRATDVRALNTFQDESSIFFTCLLAGETPFLFS